MVYNTIASQAKSIELFHVQQHTQRLRPPQTAESEAMNSAAKGALMESMPRRSEINLTLVSWFIEILRRIQVTFTILPQKVTRWGSEQLKCSPPTILSAIFTTAGNRSCGHLAARGHCLLIKGGDRALQRYDKQRAHERHNNDTWLVWMDCKCVFMNKMGI